MGLQIVEAIPTYILIEKPSMNFGKRIHQKLFNNTQKETP